MASILAAFVMALWVAALCVMLVLLEAAGP
jgi:hypothetical protein